MRRLVLALALTPIVGAGGCGGDDDEAPARDLARLFAGAIPDEPQTVFLLDMAGARRSPYAKAFGEKFAHLPGWTLKPDDVSALMIAEDQRATEEPGFSNMTLVVRTRAEHAVDGVFAPRFRHEGWKVAGFEAQTVHGGFFPEAEVVRLDATTFLFYRGMRKLEKIVTRWREGRAANLLPAARALLDGVKGWDACLLHVPGDVADREHPHDPPAATDLAAEIHRVRFSHPLEYSAISVFANEERAKSTLEARGGPVAAPEAPAGSGSSADPAADALARANRAVTARREGVRVLLEGRLAFDEFRALLVGDGLPVVTQRGF